ncbi:MAG: LysR substrate-binding domain-containing protein [Pseudomonadota bacterium]
MINFTLKQLRTFEAVASHQHFGRAAKTIGITQPALSAQVMELERQIGTVLFERGKRAATLTAAGEALQPHIRAVLAQAETLRDVATTVQGGQIQRLRLGIIPTIAPYLLPSLMQYVSKNHTNLDVQVRETLTDTLMELMELGRLDAAILAFPVPGAGPSGRTLEDLVEAPLFSEEFVLVRPAAEAHRPVPNAQSLSRMRLLLLEEGHCFRDQALSFCKLPNAVAREGLDGCTLTTLVQMVGLGMGVTLIPDMAIDIETRSAAVGVARFAQPKPERTVGLIWRKTALPQSIADGLIAHLRASQRGPVTAETADDQPARRSL